MTVVLSIFLTSSSFADTNWAQPPAACIEDLVPKFIPCLDLSSVPNPTSDFPTELSESERKYWTVDHRADLNLCRAREVQRREAAAPGTLSPSAIAWAWMWTKSVEGQDEKLAAIYAASTQTEMPPQILFGALRQESLLSDLGITPDGGNYSCGIGQINILEWCRSVSKFSEEERIRIGWSQNIPCTESALPSDIVRPFYEQALRKLGDRPDYELAPIHFEGITYASVVGSFPAGEPRLQRMRFSAIGSFVRHCSEAGLGIRAKALELRALFDSAVPTGLRNAELYKDGETFQTRCREPYPSRAYPFHTGWLLADAIYNAGTRQVAVLQHYFRMTRTTHESGTAWRSLTPIHLIEALHWGGKWNAQTGKIEYQNVYGTNYAQGWFKSCVVQRHIARVVQYSVLPGFEIVRSLETEGCSQTKIPEYRKKSSGRQMLNLTRR
jgi:hypothetical protein